MKKLATKDTEDTEFFYFFSVLSVAKKIKEGLMKIKTYGIPGMVLVFIIIYFGLAAASAVSLRAESEGIKYIDAHNHLMGRFGPPGRQVLDYEGAARVALSAMDKYGIKKMLIMPPPFQPDNKNLYECDDFLKIVKKYPDRFAFLGGGGTLNVKIQEAVRAGNTGDQLKRKFKKKALEILLQGAKGFGEFAIEHLCLGKKHNHQSAPADHPLFFLLADIAAKHDVPIDIHMEAVPEKMPLPNGLSSPPNPKILTPNLASFERLLAYNRKAKIIWSHVGWDNTGHRTAELTAQLLKKHPNLYMSFKISPGDSVPENRPIQRGVGLKPEWLKVIREFPDRFIIGSDHFFISPKMRGRVGPPSVEPTHKFFSLLPLDLARKVGIENPKRLFKLD
jgi:predicted TIM-barrel fold metal-dependent hydrolase